jgi:glyoxylase-like metal-dependent hydrolase (beta-lactamase superfamily II)/rhodanese-related sulfurtransferase
MGTDARTSENYREIDASELAARLGTDVQPFVLDVREPSEFAEWSIPTATNVPLADLPARLRDLPRDRVVVVTCATGSRSARAAEVLAAAGLRVANLRGGMAAWGSVYDSATVDVGDVRVVQVRRRGKGCLSYLVGGRDEAFAVDPSIDTTVYDEIAAEHGWRISRVFDTHLHADHVSGARMLAAKWGATLHLNPADSFSFPYEALHDGDRFILDDATFGVAVLTTPGHTQGSTIYTLDDRVVLSGDTLFVDGVGRPDLAERAEEFARNLYRSLHDTVLGLGDDALVLPGHYGDHVVVRPDKPVGATLGELRATLPELALDEDGFVKWATARATPRPPNYAEIITVNMGRRELPTDAVRALEAGPNRCSV